MPKKRKAERDHGQKHELKEAVVDDDTVSSVSSISSDDEAGPSTKKQKSKTGESVASDLGGRGCSLPRNFVDPRKIQATR